MTAERALGVETEIVAERGQWAVDVIVFFEEGVVRRRIATYRTEALAKISANCYQARRRARHPRTPLWDIGDFSDG